MALVREVIFFETFAGSRFSVSAETSANTGVAPWYKTQLAVAQKVIGVVIASSPAPSPAANAAPCKAAVPELKLTAMLRPDPRGKPFFELANLRSRSQPVRLQNLNHRLNVGVIKTLPPVRQHLVAHRSAAMDSKRPCPSAVHVGMLRAYSYRSWFRGGARQPNLRKPSSL